VFSKLFLAAVRYSGASLSITLGTLLAGAIAPFVVTALFSTAGNSWPVTAYAVTVSLISWLCVLGFKEPISEISLPAMNDRRLSGAIPMWFANKRGPTSTKWMRLSSTNHECGDIHCLELRSTRRACPMGIPATDFQSAASPRWLERLPSPFTQADMQAGYIYDLAFRQFEVSDTCVFDRPQAGRMWFEGVIRDHLDIGRPHQIALVFNAIVRRTTPGTFRTRVLTKDVDPTLCCYYKSSRLKQYFKEGKALRTETVICDTKDFGIGRRVCSENWRALKAVGESANRRLCDAEAADAQPAPDVATFSQVTQPSKTKDGSLCSRTSIRRLSSHGDVCGACWILQCGRGIQERRYRGAG
jgi:hypothetical protein